MAVRAVGPSARQTASPPPPHPLAYRSIRPRMAGSEFSEEFLLELMSCQGKLHVYILSLLVDKQRSYDVLQQTNVVLLEKAKEYEAGTNFAAWACRVAFYEVLAERRRKGRDRHVFDEEVLGLLADDAERQLDELNERAVALDACLKKLTSNQRRTLMERYSPGGSVKSMAEKSGRTPNAVSLTLHRLRAALADCIRRRLESRPT